jgi:tRNA nucleotidyltransferase/poly(A) polymerase
MATDNLQREFAEQVVKQLRSAGHEALWAGGCVRDALLGRAPKDYDVATSARPEQVRELFGHRRTLAIGAAFGVISVLGGKGRNPIEVATFRSDGAYIDGRHPAAVTFTTAEEDAQRRDFTINGLFFDPVDKQVIDFVGGQEDLERRTVRAIGDPYERFAEDKLRMLRAVRFAATLGFRIEPNTFAAVQSMADEIHVVSAERIGGELGRMLVHRERGLGFGLLHESKLLAQLMPEAALVFAEQPMRWQSTLDFLKRLESDSLPVAFATLLWNSADAEHLRQQGVRFRFSNREIDRAAWLISNFSFVSEARTASWPQLQRRLVHEGSKELMEMATAVLGKNHEGVAVCQRHLQLSPAELNPPWLVSGDDLVAHGLRPGKYFGELLSTVRDAQLEGQINDLPQALALVDKWMKEQRGKNCT